MATQGCNLNLVRRGRHKEFNVLARRTIGLVRPLARAVLVGGVLDNSFWYYAMAQAVYVKNRAKHRILKKSPFRVRYGREGNLKTLRRFGALCFSHRLLGRLRCQEIIDWLNPYKSPFLSRIPF